MQESVTATGEKSIAQPNCKEPLPYYLILAGDDLQVTFDNNGDNNYWSYHTSSSRPNVSGLCDYLSTCRVFIKCSNSHFVLPIIMYSVLFFRP